MPRAQSSTAAAKHNPVLAAGAIEASEQPLGHTIRKPTKDSQVGEPSLVQVADRMPDPEKAAMLMFMEEPVTVRIATSTDKNAEQVFEITINGRTELFRRGETKTVARKYVDRLALLKVTSYTQNEVTNAEGEKQFLHVPHTGLKYDFAVVTDANPMGADWLRATLAMPG
jgi:hypothetical protein